MISMSFPVFVALWIIALIATFCAGYRTGRENERDRVLNLMYAPFRRGRVSTTLRWVLNAVTSGSRELPSEDQFFPPEEDRRGTR